MQLFPSHPFLIGFKVSTLFLLMFLIPLDNLICPESIDVPITSDHLLGCTTGVACGSVTPDGRPLLWKTRDVGNQSQEYHYVDDGRIPFIGLCYANEAGFRYYAGVNAAGFAIENANSYNLPGGGGGWDMPGTMQAYALATCSSVDNFEDILDSTNSHGRSFNYNYGTFDAFGDAAMFEAACSSYVRFDAIESPEGFIIRSNYSYSGSGLDDRADYWGPNRHDRAYALFAKAVENEELTPKYIFQQVARNLAADGMSDYKLPYDNYYDDLPYGIIPNDETICRSSSRSVMVAKGVRPDEVPDLTTIWAMVGNPIGCIVSPLWVRAGSVPVEFNGLSGSSICEQSRLISDWAEESFNFNFSVNTWKLHNPEGDGIWDWSFAIENTIFERAESFLSSPDFTFDRLENLQILLARQVLDSLQNWYPVYLSVEVSEPIFWDSNVFLCWSPPEGIDLGNGMGEPDGYNVYRSPEPFQGQNQGDLLAFTAETRYSDSNPPDKCAFYQVIAVFH